MKHTVILDKPTVNTPMNTKYSYVADGAICGNGDIGIVMGGDSKNITIHVSKNDFWRAIPKRNKSSICKIATIDISLNDICDDKYYVEERLDSGELYQKSNSKNGIQEISVIPCATDNVLLVEVKTPLSDEAPDISFNAYPSPDFEIAYGSEDDIQWYTKKISTNTTEYDTAGIITMKKLSIKETDTQKVYRYIFYVATNHDSAAFKKNAIDRTYAFDDWKFDISVLSHYNWWKNFWSKSSVSIADEQLELNWYFGLYVMACCSRNKHFPPGIFGNFITTDNTPWAGDYHLNYNFEAPFYPIYTSNHAELGECYDYAFLDFVATGKKLSKNILSCDGVYFPVGLGPLGCEVSANEFSKHEFGHAFLGQKSNASYAATVISNHWYCTYDEEYALSIAYPYLKEVASFWETYMKFEDGRYVIYNDAIHEVPYYKPDFDPKTTPNFADDFNPVLSLGAIRMVLDCLLDIVKTLNIKEEKLEKWEHILSHLSEYPTFEKDGKTVFRYTEKGMEWLDNNALGLQHIYPCSRINIFSDKKLLEIARNSFSAVDRWDDRNAFSSYYACAARLGIDPDLIIEKLRNIFKIRQYQSMMFNIFGGCLENTSVATNLINEMMLQSNDGIICLFPSWTKKIDAEFKTLRTNGAFLVSSKMTNGEIEYAKIECERDGILKIHNPYKSAKIKIDLTENTYNDEFITLDTKKGDIVYISKN